MQIRFAGHMLDFERRELCRGGRPVAVEPQVFDLLIYLLQNRDRVVTKDDLIASVWRGRIVSDSTLASRINAARKAIGDSGAAQALIRTVARKGFRFVGELEAGDGAGPLGRAAPAGVVDWLRSQNLRKYEDAFRDDAIDLDVLPDLTDGDLARLGMSLGDRKRFLKAVAGYKPSGPPATSDGSTAGREPVEWARPTPTLTAERPSWSASSTPRLRLRPNSTPRIGATWSAPVSTSPVRL